MERKIGEIFEYNGDWYQCLLNESDTERHCCNCDIAEAASEALCKEFGRCGDIWRRDGKNVFFKKLEKVGEPYAEGNSIVSERMFQKYRTYEKNFFLNERDLLFTSYGDIVSIEIKQTKEDVEENKTTFPKEDNALTRAVYAYVNGEISDKEPIRSIKEMSDEYPYNKNSLKPFDLQKAKQGKPVCTRDGRKARIICFDRKSETPITVLVTEINGIEAVYSYPNNGIWDSPENTNGCDLMMLPEKKEMWINIYNGTTGLVPGGCLYNTEEEAKDAVKGDENYVTTTKACWEE